MYLTTKGSRTVCGNVQNGQNDTKLEHKKSTIVQIVYVTTYELVPSNTQDHKYLNVDVRNVRSRKKGLDEKFRKCTRQHWEMVTCCPHRVFY